RLLSDAPPCRMAFRQKLCCGVETRSDQRCPDKYRQQVQHDDRNWIRIGRFATRFLHRCHGQNRRDLHYWRRSLQSGGRDRLVFGGIIHLPLIAAPLESRNAMRFWKSPSGMMSPKLAGMREVSESRRVWTSFFGTVISLPVESARTRSSPSSRR